MTIPLADDLETAALEAKTAGTDITVTLPWRAGFVIAEALRDYFDDEREAPCLYCGHHRESKIDRVIEILADETHRLAYILADFERIICEQGGPAPRDDEQIIRDRLLAEIKTGILQHRVRERSGKQRIPISDDLRATIVKPQEP